MLFAGSADAMRRMIILPMKKAFKTDIIHSRIIGDEIPHAHIWLIPIHTIKLSNQEEIAQKIKENL